MGTGPHEVNHMSSDFRGEALAGAVGILDFACHHLVDQRG